MSSRPLFLPEGPDTACILHGQKLGWANCTCLSFGMGIDRSTLGAVRLSGCQLRDESGDYVGGTSIDQMAIVAARHHVVVDVRTGPRVVPPHWAAIQLQNDRAISLAGNASALVRTQFRSTGGPVNHNILVNEVQGGAVGTPLRALVYDPAANGRAAPWGRSKLAPQWWPWSLVLAFAAALRPWGDADPRLLGPGRWYAGVFPSTALVPLWGSDVAADVRALDPMGRKVAAAIRASGRGFGSVINLLDIEKACNTAKILYKKLGYANATKALLAWAVTHRGLALAEDEPIHLMARSMADAPPDPIPDAEALPTDVRDGDVGQYEQETP
jgi:hypothetical protein